MKNTQVKETKVAKELKVLAEMSFTVAGETTTVQRVKDEGEIKYVVVDEKGSKMTVGESFVRKGYPWAISLLPLSKLTKKQEQVLRCVKNFAQTEDLQEEVFQVEDFKSKCGYLINMTQKAVEGILSSLWVKGYITMAEMVGPGVRYFTVDSYGLEYLKDAEPMEFVEREEDEEVEEGEEA